MAIEAPQRFFFYGTLIAGSANPVARAAHRKLRCLGPATATGLLYAVPDAAGWYPALIAGDGLVRGELYEAADDFAEEDLTLLDRWEEFDPEHPAGSPYRRDWVELVTPPILAQAYRFGAAIPQGAIPIAYGDFRAWLEETNLRAFAT